MPKEYKVQTTGRRWFAISKLDDGTFQMRLMLGDAEKPLATLIVNRAEFKRLATTVTGLLAK